MKRLPYPLRVLFQIIAVVVISLVGLRFSYTSPRDHVRAVCPTIAFARLSDRKEHIHVLGPHLGTAYYTWVGPEFLEAPLRLAGLPWFEQIEFVSIYVEEITPETIAELSKLPSIKTIEFTVPTDKTHRRYQILQQYANRG